MQGGGGKVAALHKYLAVTVPGGATAAVKGAGMGATVGVGGVEGGKMGSVAGGEEKNGGGGGGIGGEKGDGNGDGGSSAVVVKKEGEGDREVEMMSS